MAHITRTIPISFPFLIILIYLSSKVHWFEIHPSVCLLNTKSCLSVCLKLNEGRILTLSNGARTVQSGFAFLLPLALHYLYMWKHKGKISQKMLTVMHRPISEAAWCRGQHLVAEGTKEVHRSPQSQGVDLTQRSLDVPCTKGTHWFHLEELHPRYSRKNGSI